MYMMQCFFFFFFFCTKISGKDIQYYIPSTESHGFDSLVLHLLTNNYELLFLTKVTKANSIEKDKKKKNEMKYQEWEKNCWRNVPKIQV